jgi:hypothetical protein
VANRFSGVGFFDHNAVAPVKLKYQNPLELDMDGRNAAAFQWEDIARRQDALDQYNAYKRAWDDGYDAVIARNTKDEGDVYIVPDMTRVRSVNAMFDPAKSDSANLLAANPLAGALTTMYDAPPQQGPTIGEVQGRRIPPEEEAQRQALIRYLQGGQ